MRAISMQYHILLIHKVIYIYWNGLRVALKLNKLLSTFKYLSIGENAQNAMILKVTPSYSHNQYCINTYFYVHISIYKRYLIPHLITLRAVY